MTTPRHAELFATVLFVAVGCSSDDMRADTDVPAPLGAMAGASGAGLGASGASGGAAGTVGAPTAGMAGAPGSSAMAGSGAGMAGSGAGMAGNGAGMAGSGASMAGSGAGMAGTGGMPGTAGSSAMAGTGGMAGSGVAGAGGTAAPAELPECDLSGAPDEFEVNASVGGGGSQYTDSPHFRIYGASGSAADAAIQHLEAAYSCFVETLCWRSSGLSFNGGDDGPYYKMNIYGVSVSSLNGAAGVMSSDAQAGLSFLRVGTSYLSQPRVTVHEYGHALTYHEKGWVRQTRTGAWWETVANWVADTYLTSRLCEDARERYGVAEGDTLIELNRVIGDSYQVIVDGSQRTGNYYQAWPFLTYLTTNPDGYPGLGATALRDMFRNHMGNNETPLHVLERMTSPVSVQTIVGRYWARMAYLDIGHPKAQEAFFSSRSRLNFANLESAGGQTWRVRANRQPRYFGSNIIPLDGTGDITVRVTSGDPFTATLAIRSSNGSVRYVDLEGESGQATIQSGEEASLVVVNTPDVLYQYDPFDVVGDVARGLDYEVQITGAAPSN